MLLGSITKEEEKKINNILDNSINKIRQIKKIPNSDIFNNNNNSFHNDFINNNNIRKTYNIESNNINNISNRSFNNIFINNDNNNFNFYQKTKNLLSNRASSAHDRFLNISNYNKTNNNNKTKNKIVKKNNIDYELKCEKLRNELSKLKNDLVQERLKSSQLLKEYNKLAKKEDIYDKTFEENQNILNYNEILYQKIKESEEIRKEQNLVINSLKLEYNELLQFVNPEKYEKLFLKSEEKTKTKKKKILKKKK